MAKNHKRKYSLIHFLLSQNFHQSSKDIAVWLTLFSQGFVVNFHQKLIAYFCLKHLLKSLNQGQYGLTNTEKLTNFFKKHIWFIVVFFFIISRKFSPRDNTV